MKREVVQDFLNLPGIVGVALMDGRSRPYFCGVDQTLNFQQKEALAQGIQQVVDTTPPSFEFFEFQFSEHQIYIYKLDHGIILLVLTSTSLVYSTYVETVQRLKAELQADIANAIATFRLLAGNATLSGQNYWKRQSDASISTKSSASTSTKSSASTKLTSDSPAPVPANPVPLNNGDRSPVPPAFPAVAVQSPAAPVTIKEMVAAMNQLSQFTTQYLGATVVTNYWKTTRPQVEWLSQFEVERPAHIRNTQATDSASPITTEQQQWLRDWVDAFVHRCAKVIRDFPKTVQQNALSEPHKSLLFKGEI